MGKIKNILVIDDEAVFREAMCESLILCGFRCVATDNPADGIMRIKTESFDLILLDIMMDPFDGWDTLDLIKNTPSGRKIPIIMASAKTLQADEILRYGDKVAGFLKKPFEPSEFCEDIQSFFSWYDMLVSDAGKALSQGVQQDVCDKWISISRQIHALNRLKEIVSPRCIPFETSDEETCFLQKLSDIDRLINEKIQQREELQKECPQFIITP